ncbi:unnamed protein product [Gongylonema pulchrum]|uniref:Alpha-1,3-glucosyltransferase n=1 Tax=Gongylonema pulchrum TaxID=637853 RepID=A0A183DQV7_9BILA|nr:unnamed protein product [Gongylonema pulchrum]
MATIGREKVSKAVAEKIDRSAGHCDELLQLKAFRKQWFWKCCAAVFTVKFLLIPCYHSTDFEVHRNWMAITHTLPLQSWYYDSTSHWTLDYPPFFAFFEYLLSEVASVFVPSALVLQKNAYFSSELLFFQRSSVIVTDFFYTSFTVRRPMPSHRFIGNCLGFFQLLGALSYCVLLNMKHIYLYYGPAYVLFFAVNYLAPIKKQFVFRCIKLALVIFVTFALSLGPFVYACGGAVLLQIWRRLFPFKRGLTHAYWAPNLWAIYNFIDWYFYQVLKLTKRLSSDIRPPMYTSGLVQEFSHSVLPSVSAFGALITTGVLLMPVLMLVGTRHIRNFPLLLTLSAFAFFLAGYHVHEKAVILITIPYTVLAAMDHRLLPSYLLLSFVANVSLFPLFFTLFENLLKVSISLCYLFFSWTVMRFVCPQGALCVLQKLYICGLLVVQIYCLLVHQWLFGANLKFIPLMLTSLSTAAGICWAYLELLWIITFEDAHAVCICGKKQKSV